MTAKLAAGAVAFSIVGGFFSPATQPAVSQDHTREHTESLVLSQSEPTLIPGTSVSLRPPANFVLSEQFSGFIDEETSSSITLTELPLEAYSEIAEQLSSTPEEISELFASRGVTLNVEEVSSIVVQGNPAPFVKGVQTTANAQVQKYFVLLRGDSTVLLTFNVFDESQLSEQTVIEIIQSIEISSAPSIQQKVAELSFTFTTAEPFEVFDVLLGSSVVLSPNGEIDPSGEAPIIVIANSLNPVQTADIAEYSAYLLTNTAGFEEAIITEQQPVEFVSDNGYFIRATSPEGVILQYLAIQPDNSYIRMIAIVASEEIEQLLPTIETIQRSVALK